MKSEFVDSIGDIDAESWNRLCDPDKPFLRHEFLWAMEASGSVSAAKGWVPKHFVLLADDNALIAAAPGYIKSHSYGEYVFDWAWADAYARHGLSYYPKLLTAVPFTPCVGPRLLVDPAHRNDAEKNRSVFVHYNDACIRFCKDQGLSSWHILFPDELPRQGDVLLQRTGTQFHWYNRGYTHFADFLTALNSRKRKSIKRERRQLSEAGISFEHVHGADMTDASLSQFYDFYASTYMKRGQIPYLNLVCFEYWRQKMPEKLLFVFARQADRRIAGAMFLLGERSVYGRYWGSSQSIPGLHFETCYYQGIEYCIDNGYSHFDAGAQGEHKLIRGFEPVSTCSYHWLAHPEFNQAVADFLEEETQHVEGYRQAAVAALPYRKTCDN